MRLSCIKSEKTFDGGWADEEETKKHIRNVWEKYKYLIDPHTAVGFAVLDKIGDSGNKKIVLSTANPYKFTSAVLESLTGASSRDGFEDMEALMTLTGTKAPESLSGLKGKKILHDNVCGKRTDGRSPEEAAVMSVVKKRLRPFSPEITFLSGQCFRWEYANGKWVGTAGDKYAEIEGEYPNTVIRCNSRDTDFWEEYFDSGYDYDKASGVLEKDEKISEAVKRYKGLILLRQPFFETLISFIISANNNIPRIKKIINNICVKYGRQIETGYAFPEPQALAALDCLDLMEQNCGYRSDYIIETSRMICDGYSPESLKTAPLEEARQELCRFKGVGRKVADCVLIYSLGRKDAYPVDTWIRKASFEYFGKEMTDEEIRRNAKLRFGDDAALAQQYMFVAGREK